MILRSATDLLGFIPRFGLLGRYETVEHSADTIDSLLNRGAIAFRAECQPRSELELNIHFTLRSQRNVQVMHEGFPPLPTCAFTDVGGNRNCCPAQLGCQTKTFIRRKTLRERIDFLNERHRLLPHLEIAKRASHLHDAAVSHMTCQLTSGDFASGMRHVRRFCAVRTMFSTRIFRPLTLTTNHQPPTTIHQPTTQPPTSNRRNAVDFDERVAGNAARGGNGCSHRRLAAKTAEVGFVHRGVVL